MHSYAVLCIGLVALLIALLHCFCHFRSFFAFRWWVFRFPYAGCGGLLPGSSCHVFFFVFYFFLFRFVAFFSFVCCLLVCSFPFGPLLFLNFFIFYCFFPLSRFEFSPELTRGAVSTPPTWENMSFSYPRLRPCSDVYLYPVTYKWQQNIIIFVY